MNQDESEINLINKINPNIFNGLERVGIIQCKCGRLKEWYNNKWYCQCDHPIRTDKGKSNG